MDDPSTEIEVRPEPTTSAWDLLAVQVEAFIQAWETGGDPPEVAAFLPDGPPTVRRLTLLELLKVDLDYRWTRRREPRTVEEYLAAFPEAARGGPPCDLLYEEFHVRKRAGDAVEAKDFLARFPAQAEELGRLLGLEASHLSSCMSTRLLVGRKLDVIEPGGSLGDFDLLALLGKGAFARVFLARQRSMQRLVALKVSADAGAEPATLAQLDHPHIVRVYDQRQLPVQGLGLLYMQYVSGGTLQSVLDEVRQTPEIERSGRTMLRAVDAAVEQRGEDPPLGSALRARLAAWSWPEAVCWLGARLAEALDYAHRQGVLHRDVKPANVLLTAEGAPKLADFNISFSCKLDGANPAAFFGGSLVYMSPEQVEAFNPAHSREAGELDGRSDLYSLCIVLWELLVGRRPFRDESPDEGWGRLLAAMTERRRKGVDPVETASLPAGLPAGLAQVLLTGLEPDPNRRHQTGAELARDLELCLQPRARGLLYPAPGGWKALVRRFGLAALLLTGLVPNALAAQLNIAYNLSEIVNRLHVPEAETVFWNVQAVINSITFPSCLALLALLALPALRAVRRADAGKPFDADRLAAPRRRCLILGDGAAVLSMAGWSLAAPVYPSCMYAFLGAQSLPPWFFRNFIVSLVLCGLIAAVYPFFAATFLAVRVLFPVLARRQPLGEEELSAMDQLKRRVGLYLLLAAVAPMLTVAAWAFLDMGSDNRWAMEVLSVVGLAGFGAAFALARTIQADLEALARTTIPAFQITETSSLTSSSRARAKA